MSDFDLLDRTVMPFVGSKHYQAKKIIAHFPRNYESLHYLEAFPGGLSVFRRKKPSRSETICEIWDVLSNFYIALQSKSGEALEADLALLEKEIGIAYDFREFGVRPPDLGSRSERELMIETLEELPAGSEKIFEWIGETYADPEAWDAVPRPVRAAYFFFCQWNRYVGQYPDRKLGFGTYSPPIKVIPQRNYNVHISMYHERPALEAFAKRLNRVNIISGDVFEAGKLSAWCQVEKALIYADPWYFEASNAFYPGLEKPDLGWYERLFELFRNARAKLLITIDFPPEIEALCADHWTVIPTNTVYKTSNLHQKASNEVIIINYPLADTVGVPTASLDAWM
jgi:site-specific DNA-adenine methylase